MVGVSSDGSDEGWFFIRVRLTNLESALVGSCDQVVDDRSPGLSDTCKFPWLELGGDVVGEVDHEVSPAHCALAIIVCLVAKISCGLLAALIPVVIAAEFEKNPSASFSVNSSMSMVFWCRAMMSELYIMS